MENRREDGYQPSESEPTPTWTQCHVRDLRLWGHHGGRQFKSPAYFFCGCDEGVCERHATAIILGPVWEHGEPKKCATHKRVRP